jgi:hypothetical protein
MTTHIDEDTQARIVAQKFPGSVAEPQQIRKSLFRAAEFRCLILKTCELRRLNRFPQP